MIGPEQSRSIEKNFLLQMIDMQWREHLMHLDHLRNVIGLRSYGQRDPLNEYKTEAFSLFEKLLADLRQNVTRWLMTVEFRFEEPTPMPMPRGGLVEVHMDPPPARTSANWPWPRPPPSAPCRSSSARPCRCPPCPPTGNPPAATRLAPAAPARSSSTATGRWSRATPAYSGFTSPACRDSLPRHGGRVP